MKYNRYIIILWFISLALATGSALKLTLAWGPGPDRAEDMNTVSPQENTEVSAPVVLWFHSVSSNPIKSLKLVLDSGIVSDILMLYMHRNDADFSTSDKAQEAIKMVKQSQSRLIWCRDLWPYYKIKSVKPDDIYDPNYYIEEIRQLRIEAKEMNADAVALDIEPYGKSPMKLVFKNKKGRAAVDRDLLNRAVEIAVQRAGKVDYILPGGSTDTAHPYNILSKLGKNRIAESTYYYRESRLKRVRYPYEIFGAYVNIQNYNKKYPLLPYYRIVDIFEQSQLWSDRKGVFLYTDGKSCTATAQSLIDYVNLIVKQRK